jgi:two-component system response regulator YesN
MRNPTPHVLIVDDDASVREALATALEGAYVVHAAANGKEACAILRTHPIAAIVLDAVLGTEHGLDLVHRFRAISQAPIMILTGYGSEDLAIRALREKVSDYLRKPVNLKELRASLVRLMHQDGHPPDPVVQARRHLVEHIDRQHTTASLAKEVGLSERHLRRRFREMYGKSPRRYLTEVRMKRAGELLRKTQLGVEQIARSLGYPSIATFDRIFKRAFGTTPSQWRAVSEQREHGGAAGRDSRAG